MYPNVSPRGARGRLCHISEQMWSPSMLSWPGAGPSGAPSSPASVRGFLLLTSVRKKTGARVYLMCKRNYKSQRTSCSFSLNRRDSYSQWQKLAYPTYVHLNASRQLRGINKTSLFQFEYTCFGKKKKKHFCVFKWKWHHALTATLTCLCFTSHRNVGQSVELLFGKVLELFLS